MIGHRRRTALVACLCVGVLLAAAGRGAAQTYRERGAYLVNAVAVCGNCHTPRDAANTPIPGMELAGGREFDIEAGHIVGSNITPDRETGIGNWSVGQIVSRRLPPMLNSLFSIGEKVETRRREKDRLISSRSPTGMPSIPGFVVV